MVPDERRQRYARAIWAAMVDDEPPLNDHELWLDGYLDAADAVIALADAEVSDPSDA
jgi:hypothetical protein